ncbi:MAG: phospholipase A [Pseudomonadota bacterium]
MTVKRACVLLLLSGMLPLSATGGVFEQCVAIVPDAERLACYDQVAAQSVLPSPVPAEPENGTMAEQRPESLAEADSFLGKRWELDERSKNGTFRFREYKPVYILPFHHSNNPNQSPTSPAPDHSASSPMPSGSTDVKYQLSFKTKLWEDIFGDNGNLWFGYTQQSHWLLYNSQVSSPFRETNYEPELIFSLRTDVDLPGMRWRMLNLGLAHQSNGRGLPLSRSWNRVYAQFGLERDKLTLFVRPWLRLPEHSEKDDNPDISRFMGNGDVQIDYRSGENTYSALGRYSLSGNHGALQLSWGFPISRALKGYLQVFSGYGESLIDYNHNQTSIGLGFSLQEWR